MSEADLLERWQRRFALPPAIGLDLLQRWDEPHRHYHGPAHLHHGLTLLDQAQAPHVVELAWWFHDAVHSNRSPADEQASAALAEQQLSGLVEDDQVAEVVRLVLLTSHHQPRPDDQPGALLCDTDLHPLSLPWPDYTDQVAALRAERLDLDLEVWQRARAARLRQLLARPTLFHSRGTGVGEAAARANLSRELDELAGS